MNWFLHECLIITAGKRKFQSRALCIVGAVLGKSWLFFGAIKVTITVIYYRIVNELFTALRRIAFSICIFNYVITLPLRPLGMMGLQWYSNPRKTNIMMETFSALLAICAGNSPVPGEFSTQRPVTRSFDVLFDLRLNKRLSKQSWSCWFDTLSRPLWRQCNDR